MSELDLVTGATGFIGRHLGLRLLREGRRARVLCRAGSESKLGSELGQKAEIAYGDLRDRESLRAAVKGASRVFHCAGQVSDWGSAEDFHLLNVEATRWLAEAAAESAVKRFVHFSSIAAFGTPSPAFFDDWTPHGNGRDEYSRTKAEGERVVLEVHQRSGLPITILRPPVVYGQGGTWLEEPMKMIQQNKMFLLGGGTGTCHPCYIENLVDAAILVAGDPRAVGKCYIVSDGGSMTFKEFFDGVAAVAGRGPIKKSIPLPVARAMAGVFETVAKLARSRSRPLLTHTAIDMVTTRSRMSCERIEKELGFRPRYRFHDAIEELRRLYSPRELPRVRYF